MLDEKDIARLKEIFVQCRECDRRSSERSEEITGLREAIAVITTKINMLLVILGAIAVPVLAIAIKLLFSN